MTYAQKKGKRDFFSDVTTVLAGSGRMGLNIESLSGSPGPCLLLSSARGSRWHDCRMIPDHYGHETVKLFGVDCPEGTQEFRNKAKECFRNKVAYEEIL